MLSTLPYPNLTSTFIHFIFAVGLVFDDSVDTGGECYYRKHCGHMLTW